MKRILISLLLVLGLCGAVNAATIHRYVDTDLSTSGDGTSWATAHTSLNTSLVANRQDLTANGGNILVIHCRGVAADTTAVTLSGYTMSPTCYIEIEGDYDPANHALRRMTNKYRLAPASGAAFTIDQGEVYLRMHNLQILPTNSSCFVCEYRWPVVLEFYRMFFECLSPSGYGTAFGLQFHGKSDRSCRMTAHNNVFKGWSASNNQGCILAGQHTVNSIYSNTFINSIYGVRLWESAISTTLKNNLFSAPAMLNGYATSFAFGTGLAAAGTDYNATTGTSLGYTVDGGGNTHDRVSQTFAFVSTTSGSEDYHLSSTDTGALNFGVDLSADPNLAFNDDIDGQIRSGVWDIGADEYGAGSGGDTGTELFGEVIIW